MAIDDVILNMNNLRSKIKQSIAGPVTPTMPVQASNVPNVNVSEFPVHLYPPMGSETFDIRKSVKLTPGAPVVTSVTLIDWTIPDNATAIWNGYALFSDVGAGVTAWWDILIDNTPVFPYHGDSLNSMKKTLALSTDLSVLIYALKVVRGGRNIKIIGNVSDVSLSPVIAARIAGWTVQSDSKNIKA